MSLLKAFVCGNLLLVSSVAVAVTPGWEDVNPDRREILPAKVVWYAPGDTYGMLSPWSGAREIPAKDRWGKYEGYLSGGVHMRKLVNLKDGSESEGSEVPLSMTSGETCWFRLYRHTARSGTYGK